MNTPTICTRSTYPDVETRAALLSAVALACEYAEAQAAMYGLDLDWSRTAVEARPSGDGVLVKVSAPSSLSPLVEMHAPGETVEAVDAPEGHDCGARCGDRLDEYSVVHRVHTYTACAACVGTEGIGDVPWPCPTLRTAGTTEDYRKLGAA